MEIKRLRAGGRRFLAIVLLLAVGLTVGGCGLNSRLGNTTPEKELDPASNGKRQLILSSERSQVLVYFATLDGLNLVPVTLDINPTKEIAKVAVEKLLAGPNTDFLAGTIPEGTKLKDIYFSAAEGTAYVDLTSTFLELADEAAVRLALDSLIYTLTDLQEVTQVQLYVDGRQLEELAGIKVDEPLQRERGVNFTGKYREDGTEISVYFGDENAMFLIPLTISLAAEATLSDRVDAALKHWLKGPPQEQNLIPVVWPGTAIIDWRLDEAAGLVTINFNQAIVGYGGGTTFEKMLVNSLLYTLTELPGIEAVQMLIEGEKWDYLPEGTEIDEALVKQEKLNYVQSS